MSDNKHWSWRKAIAKSALRAPTKHLLLTISLRINDMGEGCYPSIETLVKETSLSKRCVLKHLDIAEKEGWIIRHQHGFRGQKWRRNHYLPRWPEREIKAETYCEHFNPKGGEPDTPPSQKGGAPQSKGGAPRAKKVVHEVHTNSSIENLNKSSLSLARVEKNRTSCGKAVEQKEEREGEHFDFENDDWSPDERAVIKHLMQPLSKAVKPDRELPHSLALWNTAAESLRCFNPEVLKKACLHLSAERFIFPAIAEMKRVCSQEQEKFDRLYPNKSRVQQIRILPDTPEWRVWQKYLRNIGDFERISFMEKAILFTVDAYELESLMLFEGEEA